MTPEQIQTFAPLLVLIPVVALVIFRNLKPRRLRVELMWLRPVILLAIAAAALLLTPFPKQSYAIPVMAVALVAGAILGWVRGKMIRVTVDTESDTVMQQASPLGVLFIFGIIAIRMLARSEMGGAPGHMSPMAFLIADASLLFGVALIGVAGVEVWMRASKVMAAHRAGKADGEVSA